MSDVKPDSENIRTTQLEGETLRGFKWIVTVGIFVGTMLIPATSTLGLVIETVHANVDADTDECRGQKTCAVAYQWRDCVNDILGRPEICVMVDVSESCTRTRWSPDRCTESNTVRGMSFGGRGGRVYWEGEHIGYGSCYVPPGGGCGASNGDVDFWTHCGYTWAYGSIEGRSSVGGSVTVPCGW